MLTSPKKNFPDDPSSSNIIETSWPTSSLTTESQPKELMTIDASTVQTSASVPKTTSAPQPG
jgi:hypothetical protein